jgi:hypothetical protein
MSNVLNGENFKIARTGFSLTCLACLTAKQRRNALKKNKTGHHIASGPSGDLSDPSLENEDNDEQEIFSLLSELSIDTFLDTISDTEENVSSLLACVDLSSLKSEGPRTKADALAKSIWEQIKYQFVYHSVYHSKQFPTARYMYHCSLKYMSTSISQKRAGMKVQNYVTRMQWILSTAMADYS